MDLSLCSKTIPLVGLAPRDSTLSPVSLRRGLLPGAAVTSPEPLGGFLRHSDYLAKTEKALQTFTTGGEGEEQDQPNSSSRDTGTAGGLGGVHAHHGH